MAQDFIRVDTSISTATYASHLLSLINQTRSLIDLAEKLKGIMDHNIAASDYTDVESLFGLTVGNGSPVYNLVAGSLAAMKGTAQSSDALTLIDRVG